MSDRTNSHREPAGREGRAAAVGGRRVPEPMGWMSVSSVVIIDDHPGFRERLATFIREQYGCLVAGSAGDTSAGLRIVRATRPDLVLIDIGLPDENGLRLAQRLAEINLGVRVVLMGENEAVEYAEAAERVGAIAYIAKTDLSRDLPRLLRNSGGRHAPIQPPPATPAEGLIKAVSLPSSGHAGTALWRPRFAEWEAALAAFALLSGILLNQPVMALSGMIGFTFLSYRQWTLPRLHCGHAGERVLHRAPRAR